MIHQVRARPHAPAACSVFSCSRLVPAAFPAGWLDGRIFHIPFNRSITWKDKEHLPGGFPRHASGEPSRRRDLLEERPGFPEITDDLTRPECTHYTCVCVCVCADVQTGGNSQYEHNKTRRNGNKTKRSETPMKTVTTARCCWLVRVRECQCTPVYRDL